MGIGSLIGAGISAAGSLFGSDDQADAAKQAAQAQVQAAQIAQQTQEKSLATAQNALQPYMTLGNQAAGQLGNQLSSLTTPIAVPNAPNLPNAPGAMTQADLEATPGYQFTLNQGLKATQNSAAARGLGVSGAALKGAASYATGLSDQTYNTRFNQAQTNYQDTYNQAQQGFNNQQQIYTDNMGNQQAAYNKLLGVTGIGQGAAGDLAGQATSVGNNIAQTQIGAGNAQAAGINAAGQAQAAGTVGVSNAFNNTLGTYMASSGGLYGNSGSGGISNGLYKSVTGNALRGGF